MKLGIIGAMDVEVASIQKKMQIEETKTVAGMKFACGTINKMPCVVVKSGIGKVNAAMCVQILADHFSVTHILNTGIAGSLNNELHINDVVISKDAVYHDVDIMNFGYMIGEMAGVGTRFFEADEKLAELVYEGAKKVLKDNKVIYGRIASGDQFIRDKEVKDKIIAEFHADCTEMEGAAIAHACYLNKIPFVIVRAISDQADETVAISYDEFEGIAAEHCAQLVFQVINDIA